MALVLKYFDPQTKQYEYGTVKDIGDLTKLLTSDKTDIVSAINWLVLNGRSSGDSGSQSVPQNISDLINEINQKIEALKQSNLNDTEVASINEMIRSKLVDVLKIKSDIIAEVDSSLAEKIDTINANNEQFIANVQEITNEAKRKSDKVSNELESVKGKLLNLDNFKSSAEANLSNLGDQISAKVSRQEFNLMDATVKNQKASIDVLQNEVSTFVKTEEFNSATGRISEVESGLSVLQSGIESKVSVQEVLGIIEQNSKLGNNLLRRTRDFYGWDKIGFGASITTEFYRECKVVQIDNNTDYFQTTVDNLVIGKTYAASIYVKTSTSSGMSQVVFFIDGDSHVLSNQFEDTVAINQWKRLYVLFVAKREVAQISFRFSLLGNSEIGYLCAPKIELEKATDWQPHIDDDYSAITRNETAIRQNSDTISSIASSLESYKGDVIELKTWKTQTSETISSTAERVGTIDNRIGIQQSKIDQMADKIDQKVTEKRVTDIISETKLYSNNKILNSDFSKDFANWVNSGFIIYQENNKKYASITRTGVTQILISSVSSNKFAVSDGDRINFGFDANIKAELDDNRVVTIEIFNIGDTRVFQKTFSLDDLTRNGDSYYGSYVVNRNDAAKAHIKLHLYKNGSISFTNVYSKIGDIKQIGWSQSPEDALKIVQELEAGIKNTASNLSLYVKKNNVIQEINASNDGLLIDFNKVHITGDTLARHLETQTLDVTRGFRVVKNGETVLGADSNGNVEMNVKKLRINSENVVTENQLNTKVLDALPKVIDGKNILLNSGFQKILQYKQVVVNGKTIPLTYPDKWRATYNGGISNPDTNYHTYIDSQRFNYPVAVFNESNGSRNWKALIHHNLNTRLNKTGNYQLSFDLFAEGSGTQILTGFFYYLKGSTRQDFHTGRVTINSIKENEWNRHSVTISLHENTDFTRPIELYIYGHNFSANSILYLKNPQLEVGSIATGYKRAEEESAAEILNKLNVDELNQYKNQVSELVSEIRAMVDNKQDVASFETFEATYKKWQEAMNHSILQSADSIVRAAQRLAVIEQNLGDGAADWIFSKTKIRLSDDGVLVGDKSSGSYVLVSGNQIAFYSGSTEPVAYITNGVLKINQAVFVKSIQVDTFVQYAAVPNHLTFRFVGYGG